MSCAGWSRTSPVTVNLSPTDSGGSGVARTVYTTDGTDPGTSTTAVTYSGPFTVASTSTVKFRSYDGAGNAEPTVSQPVQIDTVLPTTPIYCNADPCGSAPYTSGVTVTLPATDAGGSGLARTAYTTDGSDPATSATAKPYSGPFTLTTTTTVKAYSVDVAGNVEPTGSKLVQINSTGTLTTATLTPSDDSYTAKGNASATHGSERSLNVNSGTGERRAFVKFDVGVIPAGATGLTATLKLYSQSSASSSVLFTLSQVATSWNEATITWNNQPALGTTITNKAGLTNGAYNSFDLSALVTGNGTYAMAVTENNSTQRYFSSKESSPNNPPQLVLSWTSP
ncbi:MAG: CBM96 family carbohydrate-binding protein [Gaiellales bacterium]